MRGRIALWLVLASMLSSVSALSAAVEPIVLVTPDEAARELQFEQQQGLDPFTSNVPGFQFDTMGDHQKGAFRGIAPVEGSPQIVVEAPDPSSDPTTPLDILLRFVPQDGAAIDMSTFRCLYGFLKIDITDRLMARANLTGNVLQVKGAEIPPGKHTVVMEVADDRMRQSRVRMTFRVTD